MSHDAPPVLTQFQLEVARLFFSLEPCRGFLLAGGAALAAQQLTTRPTHDLDFFTSPNKATVQDARAAFVAAATDRGWTIRLLQDGETFCRMQVRGSDDLLVDLGLDSAPDRPSVASIAGPTFDPRELAGRKLVALFDRAAARDFVDVFVLSRRFTRNELLGWAMEVDRGLNAHTLAEMLAMLDRYQDADLRLDPQADDLEELRSFFAEWAAELRA